MKSYRHLEYLGKIDHVQKNGAFKNTGLKVGLFEITLLLIVILGSIFIN